jgi:hypothetical protein
MAADLLGRHVYQIAAALWKLPEPWTHSGRATPS